MIAHLHDFMISCIFKEFAFYMVSKILPNVRKYSRVFGNFVLNIIPRLALLMQIHFRLPWIGDQLHQPTTRTTYRTKIGASRYKVRVRFV